MSLGSKDYENPAGNRPLQMGFEDQLNALIYFHLKGKGVLHYFENAGDDVAVGVGIFIPSYNGKDMTVCSL